MSPSTLVCWFCFLLSGIKVLTSDLQGSSDQWFSLPLQCCWVAICAFWVEFGRFVTEFSFSMSAVNIGPGGHLGLLLDEQLSSCRDCAIANKFCFFRRCFFLKRSTKLCSESSQKLFSFVDIDI